MSEPEHRTSKTFYITSPIYYVNDVPHIGHAYTSIACDVMVRYKRLCGDGDAFFLTGTDEHGQKVEKSAQDKGISPQDYASTISDKFRALTPLLNLSNNDFIRTTEERHKKAAQAIWQRLMERGQIYEDSYKGWYSTRDEAYYTEAELVKGEGGEKLAPSGAPVEWVEEPSYFFKLSAWQDKLLEWYEANPDCILPKGRYNEVVSFVKGGLQDLSISRTSFNWGVPVPGDDKHVMYVWLDALTNYITAAGFPDTESERYKALWPADIHMVGKDILRFHAVYWPAFLMAADLPVPRRIVAHGWWTNEGQKISKSLGNVIDPHELVEQYGVDQTRYFLMREVPFGNDGNFSHEAMVNRINADLANNIGNLAQRTLSMIHKNCEGKVPERGEYNGYDRGMLYTNIYQLLEENPDLPFAGNADVNSGIKNFMEKQRFDGYLDHVIAAASYANEYIDQQAPWKLKKEDPERMATVLYTLAETIRCIAILMQPFTPDAAGALLDHLGVEKDENGLRPFSLLSPDHALKPGTPIDKPTPVFPRYVEEEKAA